MSASGITHCVALSGPGDPIWHGRPVEETIAVIDRLTRADKSGPRLYYRLDPQGPWKKLLTDHDYARLNQAIVHWTSFVIESLADAGVPGNSRVS